MAQHTVDVTDPLPICPCCGGGLWLTASRPLGRPRTTFYIGLIMGVVLGMSIAGIILVSAIIGVGG